jgi:hypothetical protein
MAKVNIRVLLLNLPVLPALPVKNLPVRREGREGSI